MIGIVSRFAIPPRSNSATGKRWHQRRGHPRAAGTGKPLIYELFESKDDLYRSILHSI